jgi:hypothetical protein
MSTSSAGVALGLGGVVVLMFVALVVTGCGRRPATAQMAPDAALSAKLAASKPADAGAPALADFSACPGAVPGSSVRVRNIQDGLQVTVTARNPKAIQEIRRRANRLASPGAGPAVHPTAGCIAGYLAGAETTTEDVKGGIRITIVSALPDGVTGLRKSTHDRAEAMARAAGKEGGAKRSS